MIGRHSSGLVFTSFEPHLRKFTLFYINAICSLLCRYLHVFLSCFYSDSTTYISRILSPNLARPYPVSPSVCVHGPAFASLSQLYPCFLFLSPVSVSISRVHVCGVTLSGETPVMLISVFSQEAPVGSSEWLALLLGMSLCLVLFGVTQYNQCVQNWSHLHHNMTVFYPRHCVILGHLVHWRNKRHHRSRVASPPECGAFFTNSRHYFKKIKHQILQQNVPYIA